jgi:NADH-quinone oxidoreductase subunit N
MYFADGLAEEGTQSVPRAPATLGAIVVCLVATTVLGLFPQPVMEVIASSAGFLR